MYRLKTIMQSMTLLNRRKLLSDKDLRLKQKTLLKQKADRLRQDVVGFLSRDDNSHILRGKSDTVKVGKGKQQKRVLNDYLHNLHLKYKPNLIFQYLSPRSVDYVQDILISLVNFVSRSICLCAKHQNFSFKLRTLKAFAVSTVTSPDTFVDTYKDFEDKLEEMLAKIPDGNIKFQQWKRVKIQNRKEACEL